MVNWIGTYHIQSLCAMAKVKRDLLYSTQHVAILAFDRPIARGNSWQFHAIPIGHLIEIRHHPNGTSLLQVLKFSAARKPLHSEWEPALLCFCPTWHDQSSWGRWWPLESLEIFEIMDSLAVTSASLPKSPSNDRGTRVARQWGLTKTCAAGTPPNKVKRASGTGDQQSFNPTCLCSYIYI